MTIRAVLFDIGGVLEINTPTGIAERWEPRLCLAPGQLDELANDIWEAGAVGDITLDDVHTRLRDLLKVDPHIVDELMDDIWTEYVGTPNTELIDYLRALRPAYRPGIISNSFVGAREREEQAHGFAALADVIVYSHEAGISKPDPRIYLLACEQLGVRPDEAVFVDDTEEMVAGARAVGMHAIRITDNAQVLADLTTLLAAGSATGSRTSTP
ncbi:putative hydrolase of the HAD superfamily [Allocatelliglobosispora scoriae]|uniref:Putative hydrolase of the HAD superfamily n=1 Tax=Allocatelliglobosispora scoriae TaxID=643052 RepID=A0A841BHM4_9ACTN|nr:HAD family phosphatase [Allocatelliglobosispora scoriae]MBB5867125.1 putative hydrolase of the HAD superfamily [Allocatelliglobosispora scoriae]